MKLLSEVSKQTQYLPKVCLGFFFSTANLLINVIITFSHKSGCTRMLSIVIVSCVAGGAGDVLLKITISCRKNGSRHLKTYLPNISASFLWYSPSKRCCVTTCGDWPLYIKYHNSAHYVFFYQNAHTMDGWIYDDPELDGRPNFVCFSSYSTSKQMLRFSATLRSVQSVGHKKAFTLNCDCQL